MADNKIVLYDDKMVQVEAKAAANEVDRLIAALLTAEAQLEIDYAKLGYLLVDVHKNLYWKYIGFGSFGEYIKSLSEKYRKGRTQLYHYFSTVRELSPYVTEEQLNSMGIAKAAELKKSVKRTGFPPSQEVIEQATNAEITCSNLRKILFETDNVVDEKGNWLDQEGFYVTDEEKLVITSADELALRIDPPVQPEVPDWVKRKESRLRQAMEFLGAHGNA